MPLNAGRVLEIGCGSAKLGHAYKLRSPRTQYFGIELFGAAAKEAIDVLDGVLCADIELDSSIAHNLAPSFDVLVFGFVSSALDAN